MKTQNERTIGCVEKQEQLLTNLGERENFVQNVGQKRSTVYFKIGLHKFFKKYHILTNTTLYSNYFQRNFKVIKMVCESNVTLI